jgi:hypothetical protein
MKLEDIMSLWAQDAQMDDSELGQESLKIPLLHHKYYRILVEEGLRYKQLDHEYKRLYKKKYEYFMGIISEEELEENNWDPNPLKILKQDIPMYMESDADIQAIQTKLDIQKQKISYIESIIKTVSTRGFLIKNAIDWERFKVGG